ncbi:MAG TPA: AAA family ATPase [Kofleriaceae bacterium]|nr:AAA family ATPase [Kofleriaceae bacterium]
MIEGRDGELARLRSALASARGGRGQLAVIVGEAGIGKTTLATALAAEAEASGAAVAWGRAWEFAEAPPYFPVAPCLRALGVDAGGDPFQLWEQVLAALARAAAPVVWIVEDLHAADLGTLDLLTFLAQPLRAMRVLIVATARDRDPRLTDRMLQRLARMARDGLELRLEPLAEREVAAVVADTLGRPVTADALAKLVELTGGNPLFVVECARAFRAAGGVEGMLGSLPPTVRQIVSERVSLLPDSAREMLAAGAILGREFAAATVARMTSTLPARVIDALLPALRAGILKELEPGRFAFSHVLVRDAIGDALAAGTRAELHGRAEAALAALGDTSEILVERARHALAAARGERSADTAALVARASAYLEREGAFDRAYDLYARVDAARAAGQLPAADPATKLHVARIARAAGRADASRRLCDAVVADARALADPELLARAALLHLADVRPGVIDRAQVALLEEARATLGDRAPPLACRVLARLATALQPAPDPAVPRAMAREALDRAHALGDPALVMDVLELAGWGIADASATDRVAWAEELLARASDAADLRKALVAGQWLAFSRLEIGDFAAFEREVARMLVAADELGHPRDRWRALLLASLAATAAGHYDVSDRYVTEVEQLASLVDEPALALSLPLHRVMRALVFRRDDDVRAGLATLDSALQGMVNAAAATALVRGLCMARLGDLDGARMQLAIVAARVPLAALATAPVANYEPILVYAAELVAAVGDDAQRRLARELLVRFEPSQISGGPISYSYDGPAARVRGLVAASLGEHDVAEAALREALAGARERAHAPWVAQIAAELAKLLAAAGRDAESRELAAESARVAAALGMSGIAGTVARVDEPALRVERVGAGWRIARGAVEVTIKDSRGVQLLARLVERPNEEIHVLALASDDAASAPESTAGEVLDERARKAYRRRLDELADALADAESRGDARRGAAIERERAALVRELARATGLGGKSRASASTTERARINIQKRLKETIARVAEADGELGGFLDRSLRTGTYCCFRP